MKLTPLLLEPRFVPRLWGARSLAPLFPEAHNLAEPIGEVWMTGEECRVLAGPYAGCTLGEAWSQFPAEWRGRRLAASEPFPLLVKFLFPREQLSVQVHPDDAYARTREGSRGKTEMWYVISAEPGAEVRVGLKPGVTASEFRRALDEGRVEQLLATIPLVAGEAVFVPAGTVHTIGPGLVLCEIQEYSDLTYRIFDYNRRTAEGRPRELHIAQALDVIQFSEQSGGKLEPLRIARGPVTETYFVACRYFATEKWEFAGRIAAVTSPEHFDLLIFLSGRGQIEAGGAAWDYAPAQVWLLPATLGAYHLVAERPTTLLRTYVPDIARDFVQRLADQRVPESAWAKLVFP
ncbi:MAG: class I mannose-6-phosphate isomerase [Acidobacteriia bacterium]|nr:class I mannose-6-phosphate isomerase [Terriglobia bacterium]